VKYGAPVREPTPSKPAVELSDEERKALLEKLKQRRRKQLEDGQK